MPDRRIVLYENASLERGPNVDYLTVPTMRRALTICMCAGYTPTATGADFSEFPVPYLPNGLAALWRVARFSLRVGNAGGSPQVNLEYSRTPDAFVATSIADLTMPADLYSVQIDQIQPPVYSGYVLRFNVIALGTAAYWTILTDLEQMDGSG